MASPFAYDYAGLQRHFGTKLARSVHRLDAVNYIENENRNKATEALSITMQSVRGARASRPRFSASGRKHSAASQENRLVRRSSAKTSRRDTDWSDRDGRAPHFLLNRSV